MVSIEEVASSKQTVYAGNYIITFLEFSRKRANWGGIGMEGKECSRGRIKEGKHC